MKRATTGATVRPVKDMILEVLEHHPQGVMLVPLHAMVDAELVNQRILVGGCSYQQMRYSLGWLRDNDFIVTARVPRTKGYFLYSIKDDGPMRTVTCKTLRAVMPDRPLSPMAFALHTLARLPGTWRPEQEADQPPAPAPSMWTAAPIQNREQP